MRDLTSFERHDTKESVLAYIEDLKAAHENQLETLVLHVSQNHCDLR